MMNKKMIMILCAGLMLTAAPQANAASSDSYPGLSLSQETNNKGRANINREIERRRIYEPERPNVGRPTTDRPYQPLVNNGANATDSVTNNSAAATRADIEARRSDSETARQARIERLNQMRQESRNAREQYQVGDTASGQNNTGEKPLNQRYAINDPQKLNLLRAYKERRVSDMQAAQQRYEKMKR